MMGEGRDGGGCLGPYPPLLNPPPPWGEDLIFGSIGVLSPVTQIYLNLSMNNFAALHTSFTIATSSKSPR
jgi:hypothetical protein